MDIDIGFLSERIAWAIRDGINDGLDPRSTYYQQRLRDQAAVAAMAALLTADPEAAIPTVTRISIAHAEDLVSKLYPEKEGTP